MFSGAFVGSWSRLIAVKTDRRPQQTVPVFFFIEIRAEKNLGGENYPTWFQQFNSPILRFRNDTGLP